MGETWLTLRLLGMLTMLHRSEVKNGLRVGRGGVDGPMASSSSSLSEMEEANVTALSGSSPCTGQTTSPHTQHCTHMHVLHHLQLQEVIHCRVGLGALDAQ